MPQSTSTVKIRRMNGETRYVCECGSLLIEQDEQISHDQYARFAQTKGTAHAGALDESKPLTCRWAGARFEIPTIELKQIQS